MSSRSNHESLCPNLHGHEADTGDVATRTVEAGDETECDRIAAAEDESGKPTAVPQSSVMNARRLIPSP